MIHPLCKKCLHTCKQEKMVKIVQCPKFQKHLSDNEFRDLIDELKAMETDVARLKKRTQKLMQRALSGKEDYTPDTKNDTEYTGNVENENIE